ncbi:MAG: hypothetical protein KDE54_36355 [Caldilineaceae bacterium]|nr:hypothetical protein [Caldilineaceae bacterium]MCB0098389.1 hypothetical protein [Caldilineaceae bacterium]MCB0143255.1 hypothetical protein [Caldilineaceae bacterium]
MTAPPHKHLVIARLARHRPLLCAPLLATAGLILFWLAFGQVNAQAHANAEQATAANAASIAVTHTVGLNAAGCATTREVVSKPGSPVYFCLTIMNTGDVTLTDHVIRRVVMQSVVRRETYTLTNYALKPGEQKEITNAVLEDEFGFAPLFRMNSVVLETPVFVTVTSSANDIRATAVSSATVLPPPYKVFLPVSATNIATH